MPDEDPAEFRAHEATWLAEWSPRDLHEHEAAAAVIRAMWREIRADRLEAAVLSDLFAAGAIVDDAERQAAKIVGMKALGTLLRYRGRIEREHRRAMEALDALRERRPARAHAATERTRRAALNRPPPRLRPGLPQASPTLVTSHAEPPTAAAQHEPEPPPALNRHQRRALAAMSRRAA